MALYALGVAIGEGSLRSEIKQTKPFPSRSDEALLGILKTADELRRVAGRLLKKSGLSLEQYNALRILRGAGERGLPTLDVAERMIERSPGITRLLDKLEAKGYVKRMRCNKDRRLVYCLITNEGREAIAPLDIELSAANEKRMTSLTPVEVDSLVQMLDRLRSSLRQME